jgi:hypothetical protein
MKALKVALLVVALLSLGIIAGCQNEAAMSSSITSSDRVVWEQGLTGFPHPRITYVDAR